MIPVGKLGGDRPSEIRMSPTGCTTTAERVCLSPKGDFRVDGKYLFEVGGKGKGFDQIKDMPNSYVVNDEVEVGFGNKIPLWLFGFLY